MISIELQLQLQLQLQLHLSLPPFLLLQSSHNLVFSCLVSRSSGWLGGALPPFSLPKAKDKDKDKWEDR